MTANNNGTETAVRDEPNATSPRWNRGPKFIRSYRRRNIAISCCLLATLMGSFVGLASLPKPRSNTVLVSLFVAPLDHETVGIDAPYYPLSNRLFGMLPSNIEAIQATGQTIATPTNDVQSHPTTSTVDESTQAAVSTAANAPRPVTYRMTDWHEALSRCNEHDELVLYVSSHARIAEDQVRLLGVNDGDASQEPISLQHILTGVAKCKAKRSLVVLEIHWPIASDLGKPELRLNHLNALIRNQFEAQGIDNCQLLLSAFGNGHARGMATCRQSLMCHFLTSAAQDPATDENHDGRLTIEEIVRVAGPRIAAASGNGNQAQSIALIGERTDFEFALAMRTNEDTLPLPPNILKDSRSLRERYLASHKLPFDPKIAKQWEDGLSSLESRWQRGDQASLVEADAIANESRCVTEIQRSLARRRLVRSDSLSIAADRFPPQITTEATRNVDHMLNQYNEMLATTAVESRDALIEKAVTNFLAAFAVEDAAVAIASLIHAIERTPSIDQPLLDLLCRVSSKTPKSLRFPVLDAINGFHTLPFHSKRIGLLLRLHHAQDRLGTDCETSSFLTARTRRAFQQLVNAQKLVWSPGMTSDAVIDKALEVAVVTAESTIAAERKVGLALKRVRLFAGTIAESHRVDSGEFDERRLEEAARWTESIVSALEKLQKVSNSSSNDPAMEIAVLHQATEALSRCLALLPTSIHCKSDFRERMVSTMNRLDSMTSRSETLHHELMATWLGRASSIDAITSYREIAERSAIEFSDEDPNLIVSGSLDGFGWDAQKAALNLRYQGNDDPNSIAFEFLEPANPTLRIEPSRGLLHRKGTETLNEQSVALELLGSSKPSTNGVFHGVWLRLTGHDEERLVPILMQPQPFQPQIDIDFGSAALRQGREVVMQLWPSTEPQPLDWSIRSNDPNVKSVVVTVTSKNGALLASAPISFTSESTTTIRFAPPKSVAAGEPAIPSLSDTLTVNVNESINGNHLGSWTVKTELRDPRALMDLGWAEYRVEENGSNQLHVEVGNSRLSNTLFSESSNNPLVRLELDSSTNGSLIDFGDSQLQSRLKNDGSIVSLRVNNLRFVEGTAPLIEIPLSFNGDPGYFELEGRFPRQSGIVEMRWNRRPRLRIKGPLATSPGQDFNASIEARNLDDGQSLRVEILGGESNADEVLWQTVLSSSRRMDCTFEYGGNEASLCVVAVRRDWSIALPSDFGTGPHRLRVSTVSPVADRRFVAEHHFLIDDALPTEIHARADSETDRTTLHVAFRPNPSGVKSLSLRPSATLGQEVAKSVQATAVDDEGTRWSAVWPKALAIPEQVELSFITGAGKEYTTKADVPIRKILAQGTVVGRVLEGSIPQPNVVVSITSLDGTQSASDRTSEDGEFKFTVAPGTYSINAEKPSTSRKAAALVVIQDHETTTTELILQRPSLLVE